MNLKFPLLLILVLSTVVVTNAQVPSSDPKPAYLVDSFGRIPNGDARGRFDLLLGEIANNPGSKSVIYVHGKTAEISARTRFYKNHMMFRRFDSSRVQIIAARNIGSVRTDFWLVPNDAPDPEVKPEAWIATETASIRMRTFQRHVRRFFEGLKTSGVDQGYIVNYGTPKQIAQREKWITSQIDFRRFDRPRITLVNGGAAAVRTVFWRVPSGAENP